MAPVVAHSVPEDTGENCYKSKDYLIHIVISRPARATHETLYQETKNVTFAHTHEGTQISKCNLKIQAKTGREKGVREGRGVDVITVHYIQE